MPGHDFDERRKKKECRLCGCTSFTASNVLSYLVKRPRIESENPYSNSETVPLAQVINECLNIEVIENARLPVHSCKKCCRQLVSWYSFKYDCLKQQKRFVNKLNNVAIDNDNNKLLAFDKAEIIDRKLVDCEIYTKTVGINNSLILTKEGLNNCAVETDLQKESKNRKQKVKRKHIRNTQSIANEDTSKEKSDVKHHIKKHKIVGEEVFQCDNCKKTFKSKLCIRRHMLKHKEQPLRTCHICGLQLTSSSLHNHIRFHEKGKAFSCQYCKKAFHYSNHLKQHIRTHTGEKPYKCDECDQMFTRSSQLTIHVSAVHKQEEKYKCNVCGKGFFCNSNFKAHMMRHNGQRNVMCNICDKRFVTKNALFRHQRLHTGDKPFVCQECGKQFADWSNRKKHMLCHHSGVNKTKRMRSGSSKENITTIPSTTPYHIVKKGTGNSYDHVVSSFADQSVILLTPLTVNSHIVTETQALETCDSGQQNGNENGSTLMVSNSFVDPSVVLLAPININSQEATEAQALEKSKPSDPSLQNEKENAESLNNAFVDPSAALLTPLTMNSQEVTETQSLETLVSNSNLTFKNNEVHLDLSSVQAVSRPDIINNTDQTQLCDTQNSSGVSEQELYKVPSPYINNQNSSALEIPEQFEEPVQDGERLEILFPDDLPIFSALPSDSVTQNMAYFLPDKEFFNHTDGLSQNVQPENVSFTIDIEQNYLDSDQQKTNADLLNAVIPCEAQSVMKILNNENSVLLFSEHDFSNEM